MPEEYGAIRASTGKQAFMVRVPGYTRSFLLVTSENLLRSNTKYEATNESINEYYEIIKTIH